MGASGLWPDRALRLYLLPANRDRAKGYRFNPLRVPYTEDWKSERTFK
jgi:hypothetical protein